MQSSLHLFLIHSQRKVQINSIREDIKCREIIDKIGGYQKPWWYWSPLKNEKLRKREEMKGVS